MWIFRLVYYCPLDKTISFLLVCLWVLRIQVHPHTELRTGSQVSSCATFFLAVFRQTLSLNRVLTIDLAGLPVDSWYSFSFPKEKGVNGTHNHTQIFTRVPGIQTWVLVLTGQATLTHSAISPAPRISFIYLETFFNAQI